MAQILIRGLDEDVRQWLRLRAARGGSSMEGEAREVLTQARRMDLMDPIGKIMIAMDGRGAEPAEAPDQDTHEHADFS